MIVVLTGGTGGAKLVEGLAAVTDPAELTVVCNTGDDSVFHGLYVAPDVDTITYTLAGLSDSDKGWGIKDDTFVVLEQLRRLGEEVWFNLGDRDLATHVVRTRLLRQGRKLSEVTDQIRRSLNVRSTILPMSDERVETWIRTADGEIPFQEYFVKQRWAPDVLGVHFAGAENSRPASGILDSFDRADAIIVAPSNPVTSIGPILAVPEIRRALQHSDAPVLAVSPLIGTAAISGPADKLMIACGRPPSVLGVAACYADFLDTIVVANEDRNMASAIEKLGIRVVPAEIRMPSPEAKKNLAQTILNGLR